MLRLPGLSLGLLGLPRDRGVRSTHHQTGLDHHLNHVPDQDPAPDLGPDP